MRRVRKASSNALSSMIGPREVFTSKPHGFMRLSSATPIRPRVRLESTR